MALPLVGVALATLLGQAHGYAMHYMSSCSAAMMGLVLVSFVVAPSPPPYIASRLPRPKWVPTHHMLPRAVENGLTEHVEPVR